MYAKVLRRPKLIATGDGSIMLRAIVGIWAVKAQALAGNPPRVKECFTFDIDSDVAPANRLETVTVTLFTMTLTAPVEKRVMTRIMIEPTRKCALRFYVETKCLHQRLCSLSVSKH